MRIRVPFAVFTALSLSAVAAPRLAIPPEGVAFGEVRTGEAVSGTAELRNVGTAPVSVSRVKACCGATAELSPTVVPPGGVATLKVTLRPEDAGPFSKTIRLSCDDPERPLVSVPVTGTVVVPPGGERPVPRRDYLSALVLALGAVLSSAALVDCLWRPVYDTLLRRRVRTCLAYAVRIGVGGVFVFAGCSKMGDVGAFAELVSRYDMLPSACVRPFAAALPFVEALAGAALVFTKWTRWSALLVAGLLLAFMAALAQAAVRGLDVSCGCFGGLSHGAHSELRLAIGRDALLLIPSLWLAMRHGKTARSQIPSPQA